jgi:uncharacterized protein
VTFQGGSGHLLSGILDLPEHSAKATVLFTHCFTCSKDLKAIVRIGRGLAESGYAVLRYDLTGLGGSQGDFSQTNFTTNRADLQSAYDFLSHYMAAPTFLIGHSFGAACSLSMTQQLPTIQAVVSLASPSDTAHLADLLQRMDPAIAAQGKGNVTIGGRSYVIAKQMLEDFRRTDLPALLRQLEKPVLLFHSPVDETLGFEHALRLYSLLTQRASEEVAAAPTSLICLPGADHLLVNNPADLRFVVQVIKAWFDRLMEGTLNVA